MSVYEILLPLILIVAAGFLTTKNGFFTRHFIGDVSKFVLYISLPAVIFGSVTQLNLSEAINKNYMLIYAVGGLLCMTIAVLYSRLIMKLKWQDCFINALGSGMPNSAFIGFPIVLSIFNGQYAEAFLMSVLIENLVFIPVCLVLLEFSNETDSSLKDQLIEIVKLNLKYSFTVHYAWLILVVAYFLAISTNVTLTKALALTRRGEVTRGGDA